MVLVTSTGTSDGKTVTVANLGIAAAKDGSYPLLIDADERARGLSRLAGLNERPGITDLTVNGESMSDVISTWDAGGTELMVVPAGSRIEGNTPSYFRSMAFREALPKLTVGRDLVLIDAPPILAVSETMDLAAIADGVVLVVQPMTPLKELEAAREQLHMVGTPLLGYVYNSETERSEYGYYGYGYGYGYGHGEDD